MSKNISKVAKDSLMRLLATKREELESAVTVGEYWKAKCEIDNIINQLNNLEDGDKN